MINALVKLNKKEMKQKISKLKKVILKCQMKRKFV